MTTQSGPPPCMEYDIAIERGRQSGYICIVMRCMQFVRHATVGGQKSPPISEAKTRKRVLLYNTQPATMPPRTPLGPKVQMRASRRRARPLELNWVLTSVLWSRDYIRPAALLRAFQKLKIHHALQYMTPLNFSMPDQKASLYLVLDIFLPLLKWKNVQLSTFVMKMLKSHISKLSKSYSLAAAFQPSIVLSKNRE